jgi:hypothetical protein
VRLVERGQKKDELLKLLQIDLENYKVKGTVMEGDA